MSFFSATPNFTAISLTTFLRGGPSTGQVGTQGGDADAYLARKTVNPVSPVDYKLAKFVLFEDIFFPVHTYIMKLLFYKINLLFLDLIPLRHKVMIQLHILNRSIFIINIKLAIGDKLRTRRVKRGLKLKTCWQKK